MTHVGVCRRKKKCIRFMTGEDGDDDCDDDDDEDIDLDDDEPARNKNSGVRDSVSECDTDIASPTPSSSQGDEMTPHSPPTTSRLYRPDNILPSTSSTSSCVPLMGASTSSCVPLMGVDRSRTETIRRGSPISSTSSLAATYGPLVTAASVLST